MILTVLLNPQDKDCVSLALQHLIEKSDII